MLARQWVPGHERGGVLVDDPLQLGKDLDHGPASLARPDPATYAQSTSTRASARVNASSASAAGIRAAKESPSRLGAGAHLTATAASPSDT